MSLAAPWMLAALAILAPVLLAFLVRRRRHVVRVPSALLWRAAGRGVAQSTSMRHLRRLLSLAACLVGVAALALAAARPTPDGRGETIAFVVDVSASMGAGGKGSPLAKARAFMASRVRSGGPRDRYAVVAAGATPARLAGPVAPGPELDAALDALATERGGADLDAAIDLAAGLVDRDATARIVVLGDGGEAPSNDGAGREVPLARRTFRPTSRDNLGIAAFATRPASDASSDEREAVVTIATSSDVPRVARVIVNADGREIARRRLEVPGSGDGEIKLRIPSSIGRLDAEVAPDDGLGDALASDDRATLDRASRPLPRVLLVTGDDETDETSAFFVEKAVTAAGARDVIRVPASLERPPPPADVAVVLAKAPSTRLSIPALYIATRSGARPFQHAGDLRHDATRLRSIDAHDALLRGVALDGVTIEHAVAITPPSGSRALVDLDGGTVLLSGGAREGAFVFLGIDPARSDLALRVAFPVLIGNAIHALAGAADVVGADTIARPEIALREAPSPDALAALPEEPEVGMTLARAASPSVLLAILAVALLALEAWGHRKGWSV